MSNYIGLYDFGYLVKFSESELALYRNPIKYTQTIHDRFHVIRDGETLYDIAREYFGKSGLWYSIADVNPDTIVDIFDLPVGETILIPKLIDPS